MAEEVGSGRRHPSRPEAGMATALSGACSRTYSEYEGGSQNMEKMLLSEVLKCTKSGDILLFENRLLGCCERDLQFDHVGLVFHGASVVPAKKANGSEMMLELEALHIVEARPPYCSVGPLEQVVRSVLSAGGRIYWRSLDRPPMEGEQKTDVNNPRNITRKMRRLGDPGDFKENPKNKFDMPGGYDFESVKSHINERNSQQPSKATSSDKTQSAYPHVLNRQSSDGGGAETLPVDLFSRGSSDGKLLSSKIKSFETITCSSELHPSGMRYRRLKKLLSYREWNQQCLNFLETPHCEMSSAAMEEASCWKSCCVPEADTRSEEEKLRSEESLFSSELVALQMLRAGWRKGSTMSDTYSPSDFADVPGERLSGDLQADVQFGAMVRIYLNPTDMNVNKKNVLRCVPEGQTAAEVTPLLSSSQKDMQK